ncbi:MAG: TonB C-terminal domain-containing protein [Gallionella sp.]|nr:TonB C-terminal domain-containing protein [Gallionella sp.]
MSATAYYYEPNKLPAGILALLVHGVFFALLYFGFSWQTLPPATMSVDLWQSLPDEVAVPPAVEKTEPPKVEEAVPPQPEIKPDIVLPDKKKVEAKPVEEKKKPKAKPVVQKPSISKAEQQAAREKAEQEAREKAEQAERAAATGRVVDEYTGKIAAKIRSRIVLPPDVADDARAEFLVTVLPGGSVLPPRLLKSSGNAAYDNAVERAIIKSQPLPLPPDSAMYNRFREMKLGFRPKERE